MAAAPATSGDNDEQLAKMLAAYYDVELEPETPVAPSADDDDDENDGIDIDGRGGGGRHRARSSIGDFSLNKLGRMAQNALATGLDQIGFGGVVQTVPLKAEFKPEKVDLNSPAFELPEFMQHKLRNKKLQYARVSY